MKNNFKSGLQKALDELENITPLKPFNCGKLCSARCCSGGDNDGMGLFPGEKELLESSTDFEINDSEGNFGEPVVVCRGGCDRRKRPLACRIFPLFPLAVERENEIVIVPVPDPRDEGKTWSEPVHAPAPRSTAGSELCTDLLISNL